MGKTSTAMELRRTLLEKKAEVLGTKDPIYKTDGYYRPFSDSPRYAVDIKSAEKLGVINAYKTLMNHEQACKELGINDVNHIGFPLQDWKDDMKLRIAVINRNDTLKKIAVLEDKLRAVLTPKELREIGIDDLAKELKDL